MIKVNDLLFSYNNQNNVINIPYWEVVKGDMIFIAGHSGSGKSTLINLLAGLLKPDYGSIKISNVAIEQLKPKLSNQFRANHIGLISQQFNLIPYLSVLDNIKLAHSFQISNTPCKVEEVTTLMERLNLNTHLINQQASELSIGQQQRVAIIRAIINKPKVLLADEPTSALDFYAKSNFIKLLKQVAQRHHMTLLFISHDVSIRKQFPSFKEMGEINVA